MPTTLSYDDFNPDAVREVLRLLQKARQNYESLGTHPFANSKTIESMLPSAHREDAFLRGRALHDWLIQAIESTHPREGKELPTDLRWRSYIILKRYIAKYSADAVAYELGISQTSYFNELKEALAKVGAYLYEQEATFDKDPPPPPLSPVYEPIPLLGHTYHVNTLVFSQDDGLLASGSGDLRIMLWDFPRRETIATIYRPRWIGALALSRDQQWLFATEGSGELTAWALEEQNWKTPTYSVQAHTGACRTMVYAANDRLYSGGKDGLIQGWSVPQLEPLLTLQGHEREIRRIAVNPPGTLLVSGDVDGNVLLWDLTHPQPTATPISKNFPAIIRSVAFDPRGQYVGFATSFGDIILMELNTLQETRLRTAHEGHASALAFHPTRKVLATCGQDRLVKLWNLETLHTSPVATHELVKHRDHVTVLTFTHDGCWLLSGSWDATILLWDMESLV